MTNLYQLTDALSIMAANGLEVEAVNYLLEHNQFNDALAIIKKSYRIAAKNNHPDRGGNVLAMQAINEAWENIACADQSLLTAALAQYSQEDAAQVFGEDIMRVINQLQSIPCDIELCGSWVWVTGTTKSYKETLKTIGLRWAPKKKAWYWRDFSKQFRITKPASNLDEIRSKHGSEKVRKSLQRSLKRAS